MKWRRLRHIFAVLALVAGWVRAAHGDGVLAAPPTASIGTRRWRGLPNHELLQTDGQQLESEHSLPEYKVVTTTDKEETEAHEHAPESHSDEEHVDHHDHEEASGHSEHSDAEHAHGEMEHEHGHTIRPTHEASALSLMLMGSVAFIMIIFYLVNFDDPQIRFNSWKVLSMTVSIFTSVLVYASVKSAVLHLVPDEWRIPVLAAMFLCLYAALQIGLWFLKDAGEERLLVATGTVFAHVVGFAAMYLGAELQTLPSWLPAIISSNFLVVLIAMVAMLAFLGSISARLRHTTANLDGVVDESELLWMEQVEDAESDVFSLGVGFLTMQVVRYYITGRPMPYHAHEFPPKTSTQMEINELFLIGILFGVLSCLIAWYEEVYIRAHITAGLPAQGSGSEASQPQSWVKIAFDRLTNVTSMTMAWCLLFWGDWQLQKLGPDVRSRVSGCILLALFLTALSFCCIFVLNYMKDHGRMGRKALRSLTLALGVLVGVSWEKSFDVAMENIAHTDFGLHLHPDAKILIQTLVLCVVVVPAWYKYILPHSLDNPLEKQVTGQPSPRDAEALAGLRAGS